MKKLIAILLCSLSIIFIIGCGKNASLKNGHYYYTSTSETKTLPLQKAYIEITGNKLKFTPGVLSSYIMFADYKIDGDKLFFTDKKDIRHIFAISYDKLIFQEGSHLEEFIKKGATFVLEEELN